MSCGNPNQSAENEAPEQTLMPKRRPIPKKESRICQRCREAKSMYIVRSAPLCKACFEYNVRPRFFRHLFPSLNPESKRVKNQNKRDVYRPPIQPGNALIALSGGAGSMAMLDLLLQNGCIGKGDGKRADIRKGEKEVIWERGTVVFVELAGISEGLEDRTEWLRRVAEERGLGFVGLRAEDVYDPRLSERIGGPSRQPLEPFEVHLRTTGMPLLPSSSEVEPLQSLRDLLASLPAASRPALFSHILNHLLVTTARSLPNISHLLLGETSTRQAQRIISGTASGRGWSLPLELGEVLDMGGVVRLQPMKDITTKEAAIYCYLNGVESRNKRVWSVNESQGSRGKGSTSLEGLTEQFIAGLSVTHPATVSTITRTGDKLMFAGGKDRETLCALCQMPIDPEPLEWKQRTALTSLSPDKMINGTDASDSTPLLASTLCYACLTTMTVDSKAKRAQPDKVLLPPWVADGAMSRAKMRSTISDYLVDGTGDDAN